MEEDNNVPEAPLKRRRRRTKAEMANGVDVVAPRSDVEEVSTVNAETEVDEELPAGFELLSEKEIEALRKEAKEDELEARKKVIKEKVKEKFLRDARRELDPQSKEDLVNFFLDLPGFADRITLDGVMYMAGRRYTVPRKVYDTLREQVYRSWGHEHEIGLANRAEYNRRPPPIHDTVVSAKRGIRNAPSSNQG